VTSRHLYVYAVSRSPVELPADVKTVGPSEQPPHSVEYRGVTATVSWLDDDWVPATRANIRAHSDIVEALSSRDVVVPMRFGTLVRDEDAAIHDLLQPRRTALRHLLKRLQGVDEFRVTAHYVEDAAIRTAATTDPSVRRLLRGRSPSRRGYHDQIAIGEAVAAAVQRVQRDDAGSLAGRLLPLSEDHRMLDGDPATVAFNAAFLVAHRRRDAFEKTLEELAQDNRDRMTFRLLGPLPAWDFAELDTDDTSDEPSLARSR
jgi:hypothetical protein